MDNISYHNIESRFRSVYSHYVSILSPDGVQNVEHYLDASELEMAYESFLLSMIEEKLDLAKQDKPELFDIGKLLGVDKDSVFRADFWQHVKSLWGT